MKKAILSFFFCLAVICYFFPSQTQADEWNQFSHDAQRTAFNPDDLNDTWTVKWIWNNADQTNYQNHLFYSYQVQPVTGNGKVYIGTMNYGPATKQNRLIALSENTGQEVWSFQADNPILHTAAYDGATQYVFFGSRSGTFYSVNTNTGQKAASKKLAGEIYAAPLIVDNVVYIGTANSESSTNLGTFYALKTTDLSVIWSKDFTAQIKAPAAYSTKRNLVIVEAENSTVYALNADNGSVFWERNMRSIPDSSFPGGVDADSNRTGFARTYPVVSDANDVVIIRVDVTLGTYSCGLLLNNCAYDTIDGIFTQLKTKPKLETLFVLRLANGLKKFTAPVVYGAEEHNWGEGCFSRDMAPQVTLKKISATEEVAYLIWRNGQIIGNMALCDARGDSTFGEMDLTTNGGVGNIRFVYTDSHENQLGVVRLASDEPGPLSMAGNFLFFNNWQALEVEKITDRSVAKGSSYTNPIAAVGIYALANSIMSNDSSNNSCFNNNYYCSGSYFCAPPDCNSCDSEFCWKGPGFYMYTHPRYNEFTYPNGEYVNWQKAIGEILGDPFERNTHGVISNGIVYYKYRDGTILALQAGSSVSAPTATAAPATPTLQFKPGDVNHDENVNAVDFITASLNWRHIPETFFFEPQPDNLINSFDLTWIIKNWGV